jgi:hypothetical protein
MSLKTQSGQPCLPRLLKLGQKEHLEKLRAGLLYMNSLAYFTALESDAARSDPHEGTDSIIQQCDVGELVFDTGMPGINPLRFDGPPDGLVNIRISLNKTSACNIFCMFAINEPIVGSIFPKTYEWPGDHFVVFTNTAEFLNRVIVAAKRQGLGAEGRMVKYYDETKYSGQVGRFLKRSTYSYQREYRIAVEPGVHDPFRFEIGDLSDITSEVISRDLADDVLKFSPEDAVEAGVSWD